MEKTKKCHRDLGMNSAKVILMPPRDLVQKKRKVSYIALDRHENGTILFGTLAQVFIIIRGIVRKMALSVTIHSVIIHSVIIYSVIIHSVKEIPRPAWT